jgi:hypothetical protein
MTIHPINVHNDTLPTLRAAKPVDIDTLAFEAAILAHWAVRWKSATPAERDTMIDGLRNTLGDKHAIRD